MAPKDDDRDDRDEKKDDGLGPYRDAAEKQEAGDRRQQNRDDDND